MNSEGGGTSAEFTSKSSDEEDDLSSSQENSQIENVLDSFRQQWKEELSYSRRQLKKVEVAVETDVQSALEEEDVEQKAKVLFLRGSELERKGKFYEAIQFYRRAVQLVPDIEFKFYAKQKVKDHQESKNTSNEPLDNYHDNSSEDNEEFDSTDDFMKCNLLSHIQRRFNTQCYICKPKLEQSQTHISALPMEIILYLLRWVVSSDLDLRSLEMFSRTCRGYYLCCRDSEIWRMACVKIWGVNLTSLPSGYTSWRHLYIERARLRFNGCYISKTTYIRHGENSFQDEFYRPWHIVTYYRYLRFFPEGQVLMLTTPDEPSQTVGQLKYRTARSASVLSGHYILKDDKVTLVVHRYESSAKGNTSYKRNKKRDNTIHDSQQTFHLEMQIQNYKKQKSTQLVWTNYSVYTRNRSGTESTYTFEIVNNRFPPLWFSRVKSYTAESFSPL